MISAEVIHRSHQIHAVIQRGGLPRQGETTTHQGRDARAEGGIQAFDVGHVDLPSALRLTQQGFDLRGSPLNHAAFDPYNLFARVLFDHLGNGNIIPGTQRGAPGLTGSDRFAKDASNGLDVSLATVHCHGVH